MAALSEGCMNMLTVNLETARRVIEAVETKARSLDCPVNIAVVDAGGNLVAHARMDNARIGAIDIAINKAWTARALDTATDDLAKLTQSGQQGFGLNTTNNSRVVIFGGGIPVKINGVVIGAIGASGGSVEEDIMVARAAVTGFVDEP